jgi:hypothetical protein
VSLVSQGIHRFFFFILLTILVIMSRGGGDSFSVASLTIRSCSGSGGGTPSGSASIMVTKWATQKEVKLETTNPNPDEDGAYVGLV